MDGLDDYLDQFTPAKPKTGGAGPYNQFIEDSAQRHGVDPDLIRAQMNQESTFHPGATSPKGASGLMQLMPATARAIGVKDLYDPQQNIEGGTKYLKQQLDKFGTVPLALAAYNAGPGAVQKYGNQIPPYKETRDYVKKITGRYQGSGYHPDGSSSSPLDSYLNQFKGTGNGQPDKLDSYLDQFADKKPLLPPPTEPTVPQGATLRTPPATAPLDVSPGGELDQRVSAITGQQPGTPPFVATTGPQAATQTPNVATTGPQTQQAAALATTNAPVQGRIKPVTPQAPVPEQPEAPVPVQEQPQQAQPPQPVDPNQEPQTADKEIKTDFTRRVDFQDKPDGVDNKEFFVQKMVPQLATELPGVDAVDIEKTLRDTLHTVKGTPLENIGKDQHYDFKMTPEFYEDAQKNHEQRVANAKFGMQETLATGGDPTQGATQAKAMGLSDEDINNITTDPGFLAQTQKLKETYQGRLESLKDAPNADILARMMTGFLTKDQATKEIDTRVKETAAQKEAENAAGFGDPEYLASHSQEYNKWKQGILSQYGSFANLQQQNNEMTERLKDKPWTKIASKLPMLFGNESMDKDNAVQNLYAKRGDRLSDTEIKNAEEFGKGIKAINAGSRAPLPLQLSEGIAEGLGSDLLDIGAGVLRHATPIFTWAAKDNAADWLNRAAEQTRLAGQSSESDDAIQSYARAVGSGLGQLPGIAGTTILAGGNPVLGFALHSAIVNSNKPLEEQTSSIFKDAVLGVAFEGEPFLKAIGGDLATSVIDKLGLDATANTATVIQTLAEKGTPIGFLGAVGGGQSAVAGGTPQEIIKNATVMAVMGFGTAAFGHEPTAKEWDMMDDKILRVPDENNKPVDVLITKAEDGSHVVIDVTGKVPDGVQQAVVAPKNQAERRATATVPTTEAEPEKTQYSSVLDEIRQKGLDTKAKIQAEFPQLSREEAADYRRQAWEDQARTTGKDVEPSATPNPSGETQEPVAPETVAEAKISEPKPAGTGLSNTQVELSKEQSKPFEEFRNNVIDKKDVADPSVLPPYAKDGLNEIEPHITVKYGLHTNQGEDVAPILKGEKPINITLGKTDVFVGNEKKIPGTDKPVPYDVVTVEVHSPDLSRLNEKLTKNTENTTTFNEYKPHITLAYVKSGKGSKYAGKTDFEGQKYTFDEVTFSPSDKSGKTVIPLEHVEEPAPFAPEVTKKVDALFSKPAETEKKESPLQKAPTGKAKEQLESYAKISNFDNTHFAKIDPKVDGTTIRPDLVSNELMRSADAILAGKERSEGTLSMGKFLTNKQVSDRVGFFSHAAERAEQKGLDRTGLDKITNALKEAGSAGKGVVWAAFKEAEPHEGVHQASEIVAQGKQFEKRYANSSELKDDPIFQAFHKELNKLQGPTSHGAAMEEAMAYLGNGDHEQFGLTEDQSVRLLTKLVTGFVDANGIKSLEHFDIKAAEKLYETINDARAKSQDSGATDESGGQVVREGQAASADAQAEHPESGAPEQGGKGAKDEEFVRPDAGRAERSDAKRDERSDAGDVERPSSKIGKSIEAKAIEKGLTESFGGTAEYSKKHLDEQAEKIADIMNTDYDRAKNMALGFEGVPGDVSPQLLWNAFEKKAEASNDLELMRDLGNSTIVSDSSIHAQEMRFMQEREPDSVGAMLQEVRRGRVANIKKLMDGRTVDQTIAEDVKDISKSVKAAKKTGMIDFKWDRFLDSIQC